MFKQCSACGFQWPDMESFVNDRDIVLIGYQVNFKRLETGFFLFNHSCGTTISCKVEDFRSLYDGPVFTERATGTDECSGACLRPNDLEPCYAKCECAFVRNIMRIIRARSSSTDE